MRSDDIGMFWEDMPQKRGKGNVVRIQPPIPDTGWEPPKQLPNLTTAKVISLDLETYDPGIEEKVGPGWARGVGHIVGVAIGADNGGRWYFPIRHEVEPEYNWDPEVVLKWLRHTLSNPKQPKVGANIIYDIGWLQQEKVFVKGDLHDVQYAEALLSESAKVGLEILGQKYLDEGKESNQLYQWCSDYYGGAVNDKQRKNIYRSPPRLVGPYAESDADLPLKIIEKQWGLLSKEGLLDLYLMECDMIPLYIAMRFAGVTVNIPYAEELSERLGSYQESAQEKLNHFVGFKINTDSSHDLKKAFDKLGLSHPETKKGNPSFQKDFLEALEHPIGEAIREIRKYRILKNTFIDGYVLGSHIHGKVYGQFHPLRGDSGGTRSGRYSSSTPNLQNLPSRDSELAPMIRGVFIPDIGHLQWRKYDYSQIEYRFLVHYAVGLSGHQARELFIANPYLDYHEFAQNLVKERTGQSIERKYIKNINFGLIYGMGIAKLSKSLGLSKEEGTKLFDAYFAAVPFAKETMDECANIAKNTGAITTILGRKSRFELWKPKRGDGIPLSYEKALIQYGNIERAYSHKALNRRLQGSAADLMKKAMWLCWKDGVFDATGVPRLTVHDELDFSDPGGKDEAFREMKYRMETALKLNIPVIADYEAGPDWGHVEEIAA